MATRKKKPVARSARKKTKPRPAAAKPARRPKSVARPKPHAKKALPRRGPATFTPGGAGAGAAIAALNLVDYAADAARLLAQAHPGVVFTSGRRGVADQARAMAGNIARNRQWIVQTYLDTPERAILQAWVDAHPQAQTKAAIAAGLEAILEGWSDAQKRRISRHFSGQAFDVQPVAGAAGEAIKRTIRALPFLRKFLEKEGGLTIWHADFEK